MIKHSLLIIPGLLLLMMGSWPVVADDINHAKFVAQKAALTSLEGDEPFILREAWWQGRIEPGKAKLLQQQLFQKNDYQYWFAVADLDAQLLLNLYDSDGNLIETEPVEYDEGKYVVSLRVRPEKTGTYYLRLALSKETVSAQDWAMIYAYK